MMEENYAANLLAGFTSFRFLPMPIVISHNNLNPKLILNSNHIEYKGGFVTRKLTYQNIEKIDIYLKGKKVNNIVIYKTTGKGTFIGNFKYNSQLKEVLEVFETKGCLLTEKAKNEINNKRD